MLLQLWKRDFAARYKSGILGITWAFINPLLMLALYSFVFVIVFKMRWGSGPDVQGNFVILLFTGLIVHGFFAEFITRAPILVSANVSYVKKVVFPLELLPLVPLLGAAINFMVGIVLVLALLFYLQGAVPTTIFLLPAIVLPYALLVLGVSYFLSATGVFVRDLTHLVGIVSTVAMFASPILFPMENVPPAYRPILYANPLTVIVEQLRDIAVLGIVPDWRVTAAYSLVALIVFLLGFGWFQATRKGFADVL
ncbi:ABC transporter permease [Hyphomicrobium sp. NDB2Meth4]|uniref:ABC transporter permease n=1 Tax=Hyphomicrobium sp. NDB2Meth4 TaxID=1892846 RepID=UPI001AECC844|nr:ABC transporter permease [Hyphomicrobium sp. NDB2Meth4]